MLPIGLITHIFLKSKKHSHLTTDCTARAGALSAELERSREASVNQEASLREEATSGLAKAREVAEELAKAQEVSKEFKSGTRQYHREV